MADRTDPQVLVTGEYFCDLVLVGLDGVPRAGREVFAEGLHIVPGGTYNIAVGLTRAGVATAWGCEFGTDIFSAHVLSQARRDGIDDRAFRLVDQPMQRVSIAFTDRDDRGFISASTAPVRPPAPGTWRPEWVIQTFRYTPDWLVFLDAMKARGARIFGDCRDCDAALTTSGVRELLARLDVFSPSLPEARALTGAGTPEEVLDALAALVPVVVLKCGAEGAHFAKGSVRGDVPAAAVPVVDAIGAGDAFNCGFVWATLHGLPLATAVEAGVLFGTRAVTQRGGSNPATSAQLLEFARTRAIDVNPALARALAGGAPAKAVDRSQRPRKTTPQEV